MNSLSRFSPQQVCFPGIGDWRAARAQSQEARLRILAEAEEKCDAFELELERRSENPLALVSVEDEGHWRRELRWLRAAPESRDWAALLVMDALENCAAQEARILDLQRRQGAIQNLQQRLAQA